MTTTLQLKYSHNIVEHLGLKLYQNQPTRVLAELVSNSWDADASRVAIRLEMDAAARWVSVSDNGHGMTRDKLAHAYLVIGHPKRSRATDKSPGGRAFMGRKGIGKLAAFGIARRVDVITCAIDEETGSLKCVWLRFDRDALLDAGDGEHTYVPDIKADGCAPAELPLQFDEHGEVRRWLELTEQGTGTLVLMSELSISRAISQEKLLESLGSRFTVMTGGKIEITVNDAAVTSENSLPKFEYRLPAEGVETITLANGKTFTAWAGFVENAAWPQDQAGVGVYAHGKIAQDRPFFFGVKGKEIMSRYMLGFIEADWLDEETKDLISTDRTSVNWDADEAQPLYEGGAKLVRQWIAKFEQWRKDQELRKNRILVQAAVRGGHAAKVTDAEEEEIVRLVSSITPSFAKDEDEAKDRLIGAVSEAWVQKPMRKLVTDLWASFGADGNLPPQAFTQIVEKLSAHSVPESLNLAVIFAQRAFALTRLYDYVHNGIETDLQKLIEKFPWIVEPDTAVLTANRSLKTAAEKALEMGHLITGRRAVADVPERNKPDFVFLSSPEDRRIVVVELKNPQEDLTVGNLTQLGDYITWLMTNYPDSTVTGYLVGRVGGTLPPIYNNVKVVPWTTILQLSRSRHIELLSAMLLKSGADGSGDARAIDAIELAGPEAQALLDRLAANSQELAQLMRTFELKSKSDTKE